MDSNNTDDQAKSELVRIEERSDAKFTFCENQHLKEVRIVSNQGEKKELSLDEFRDIVNRGIDHNKYFVRFQPSELEKKIGEDNMRRLFPIYLNMYENGLPHKVVNTCEQCVKVSEEGKLKITEDSQYNMRSSKLKQDSNQKSQKQNKNKKESNNEITQQNSGSSQRSEVDRRDNDLLRPNQILRIDLNQDQVGLERNTVLSIESRFLSDYYLCPNCSETKNDVRLMKVLQKDSSPQYVEFYCTNCQSVITL